MRKSDDYFKRLIFDYFSGNLTKEGERGIGLYYRLATTGRWFWVEAKKRSFPPEEVLPFFFDTTQTKSESLVAEAQKMINDLEGGLTITTYGNLMIGITVYLPD